MRSRVQEKGKWNAGVYIGHEAGLMSEPKCLTVFSPLFPFFSSKIP